MVIWLLGLSGTGKTTLGNLLQKEFQKQGKPSYIIDGDIVRSFFDNDLGYSNEERMANIKRVMLAAHVLEQNQIIPIVCNISPFEELRQLARKKFQHYVQVYLKRSIEDCIENDVKGMYKENLEKKQIVGIDLVFDEPVQSELNIDTGKESEEDSLGKIINYLQTLS